MLEYSSENHDMLKSSQACFPYVYYEVKKQVLSWQFLIYVCVWYCFLFIYTIFHKIWDCNWHQVYFYAYIHSYICNESSYPFLVVANGGFLSTFRCRVIQRSRRKSQNFLILFSYIFATSCWCSICW